MILFRQDVLEATLYIFSHLLLYSSYVYFQLFTTVQ